MLRITTQSSPDRVVVKLEGRLADAWVREADESWRATTTTRDGRSMVVDVCDVYAIDDAGRELLTRMHRAGADLNARGCVMREIVREIADAVARAARVEMGSGVNSQQDARVWTSDVDY